MKKRHVRQIRRGIMLFKANKAPRWMSALSRTAYIHTATRRYQAVKKEFPNHEFNFELGRWERRG